MSKDIKKECINGICPNCDAIVSTMCYHGEVILDGIDKCPECGQELVESKIES